VVVVLASEEGVGVVTELGGHGSGRPRSNLGRTSDLRWTRSEPRKAEAALELRDEMGVSRGRLGGLVRNHSKAFRSSARFL